MHFPVETRVMETQTAVSWVQELTQLDEKLTTIEENVESHLCETEIFSDTQIDFEEFSSDDLVSIATSVGTESGDITTQPAQSPAQDQLNIVISEVKSASQDQEKQRNWGPKSVRTNYHDSSEDECSVEEDEELPDCKFREVSNIFRRF